MKELKDKYSSSPQIIIAGDFNDEPFDKSLSSHLLASRDRALVMKDDSFFYNPFWRHLGETSPYIPGTRSASVAGTCFYSSGQETKWNTFDQIIVSSSFLRDDRWYLNEKCTGIFRNPSFIELVRSGSSIFDHFPVVGIIQRRLERKGGAQ